MAEQSQSELPPSHPAAKPRVIYLMGVGRSGSTILGVALGNCERFFYAGELDKWLLRSGVPQFGGSERTRFWAGVREEVTGCEELFGEQSHLVLERSSALLRPRNARARRRLRRGYGRVTEAVFRAITDSSSARYVIDSSHYPLRARELQRLDGIDLYLIFLTRDPQSVIFSLNREIDRHDAAKRFRRLLTVNAEVWLTQLLSILVFLRQPRSARVVLRHEDFLANPAGVLRELLDRLSSEAQLPDLSALRTGFPFQGNRLIRSELVALQPQAESAAPRSRITALIQLPWAIVVPRLRPRAKPAAAAERARSSRSHAVST